MTVVDPCRWCLTARVVVMIGEEESGYVLCPSCDFARSLSAGPPIDPARLRVPGAKP